MSDGLKSLQYYLSLLGDSILKSYSQVFFSQSRLFAVVLILVSLIDPYAGMAGILAVVVSNCLALLLGFDHTMIRQGILGFNSVLTGICLGIYYEYSVSFLVLLLMAAMLALFLSIAFSALLSRLQLPFLSIPFIFSVWTVLLAARGYGALKLNSRGIYTINELYSYGGQTIIELYEWLTHIPIPVTLDVYLKSLGAIFFQYNLVAGICIALGLLLYSRIAFTLSLLGFYTGYLFYMLMEGNLTELHYSYIGFNFILSAVALGYFLIPTMPLYLLIIVLTPLIALINSASVLLLSVFQLPVYSLPFNIIVLLTLYSLKMRIFPKGIHPVAVQYYIPEDNLYAYLKNKRRFQHSGMIKIALPFFGKWKVSQGYAGEITHKGEWQHALDFVIEDEEGKTYKFPGTLPEHYYAYKKPVLAPADGYVVEIDDRVEDNPIGNVNLKDNWGNTIVIKHGEGLYSQLSHLLKGSFKVEKGDYVRKGDVIALLGNSGRSPEPHLHFQVQATPHIGSKTISYPLGYYLKFQDATVEFVENEIPREGEQVMNPEADRLMKKVFSLVAGTRLKFEYMQNGETGTVEWQVLTDYYGTTYVHCKNTGAIAYFINDGMMLQFTTYKGKRNTLLHYFFLGAHKVLLACYPGITLHDVIGINEIYRGPRKWLQDLIAPFFRFLKARYTLHYEEGNSESNGNQLSFSAQISLSARSNLTVRYRLSENEMLGFQVLEGKRQIITARCIDII